MFEGLDSIPWKDLSHAYGPAEDVPALLRALQLPPDPNENEGPLWQLFGNIHHQGTVYQATAFAVPFLIELVADRKTPDRVGILQLLAAIATGSSYRAAHGNLLNKSDFEEKKARELEWVDAAHRAVAAGYETVVALTNEHDDIRMAAAHVLAQLPEHTDSVGRLLHQMLHAESRPLQRAGILLLLGLSGDRSPATFSALLSALDVKDQLQRPAAVIAIAHLKPNPLPAAAREAVLQALTKDNSTVSFQGLPWDAEGDFDYPELLEVLDDAAKIEAADRLITTIESGGATHTIISTLLDILFKRDDRPSAEVMTALFKREKPAPPKLLTARDLSQRQARAVRAINQALDCGRPVFYSSFLTWNLPDTRRGWRELATGREPAPIDMSLPLLANPANPHLPVRPDTLKPGQQIIHRYFGPGTIKETKTTRNTTELKVTFEEEGEKTLSLPSDGSPIR